MKRIHITFLLLLMFLAGGFTADAQTDDERPNILFAFADDWGYPDASIYGRAEIETPTFDRIAREGALFNRAFVPSPSCTPSRAGVLSGQHVWRLGTGANLYGPLPSDTPVYTNLLEERANYFVGHSRKGWGPGPAKGWDHNPAGPGFSNFKSFLKKRPDNRPFCFWFGSSDPHRGYSDGLRKKMDIDMSNVEIPPYLPDAKPVRRDAANYFAEVQRFDRETGQLLNHLKEIGELKNTIVVMSGDHGWPFPRGKTNLYDSGARVPLAIRWPEGIEPKQKIDALVNLADLAPTFLDVAGVEIPKSVTGHSLVPLLTGQETIEDQKHWQEVYTARERHVVAQAKPNSGGYPMRAIRTENYLYIRNLAPNRWPAGTLDWKNAQQDNAWLADCDNGPTKFYMWANRNRPGVKKLYDLSFGKRPAEELYNLEKDPHQMNNVAGNPKYKDILKRLRNRLEEKLMATGDPRVTDEEAKFDDYKYRGGVPSWPGENTIKKFKE